ncbi:hypothetical protein WJX72_006403 [[Myrmecia] bisecta]|uniref:Uncharacterized protein n=1 Tax=[Myrmecia] bisecta TaxID=41462 RepID=A0AAW1QS22_9CHLO
MGRSVIVTGASSGIGLEIALSFLRQGDAVVVVGRTLSKLQGAVPPEFQDGRSGGRAFCLAKDVSTVEGCKECIAESVQLLGGRLDVLVNNAGAGKLGLALADITVEDWEWHMNVNVRSILLLTQAAIPFLVSTKGNIVNISSIAGQRPVPAAAAYSVSKAGVDMLTRCSALELAPQGVRVNAVNPATIVTGFHATAWTPDKAQAFYEGAGEAHPIGRVGYPKDVAEMVLFLADNDKAGFITGQTYLVDGGRLLGMATPKGIDGK